MSNLKVSDPYLWSILQNEKKKQKEVINLIASENYTSAAVLEAIGSVFVNKYTEGYPEHRYYGGCENYDKLEKECQKRWAVLFHTDYHVNVQPHSGTNANLAVYTALLNSKKQEENKIASLDLNCGAHLSHGSPVNFSGKNYTIVHYGLNEEGFIDYDSLRKVIREEKPRLIIAGASAYPRIIDFKTIRSIIDEEAARVRKEENSNYSPFFMVDMAHIAGLIAADKHPSPFGYADVITTTTQKTLRGSRGGLIFCRPELARKIDSGVFPGTQGGALMNMVAGKAVTALQCMSSSFEDYIDDVVRCTYLMSEKFKKNGFKVLTNGTDNHLFVIDLSKTHPTVTGKMVQEACEEEGILLNKNCIPNETRSPVEASGIRIGCAAAVTQGHSAIDLLIVVDKICEIINSL